MNVSRTLTGGQRLAAVSGPALIVLVVGVLAYAGIQRTRLDVEEVARGQRASVHLGHVLARLVDAETAMRGYVLTGEERFLEPYAGVRGEVHAHLDSARALLGGVGPEAVDLLAGQVDARLALVEANVLLTRAGNSAAAEAAIRSGEGRTRMDAVRRTTDAIEDAQAAATAARRARAARDAERLAMAVLLGTLGCVLLALLTNLLLVRHAREQERLAAAVEEQNRQLQAQAVELEMQTEEIQAQSAQMQESMAELEMSNDELQSARAVAEEANRVKTDFLSAMSHELRTPLNAIAGYVDLMDAGIYGPPSPAQVEALDRVRRNQQSLLTLINDILHYAQIEAGRIGPEIEDLRVAELLAELEPLIAPQVRAAGLTCTLRAPEGVWVRGDRERVRQVLINLLVNATKFTPAGGSIEVRGEGDDGRVHIHVRDTGRGIPGEMVPRIFDPFVQVERKRNESSRQGVGLGLAIARELAQEMGGAIAVESTLGHGSTFTLTLPAAGREGVPPAVGGGDRAEGQPAPA